MSIRSPSVAGTFYPSDPDELKGLLQGYLPEESKVEAWAALVPHAGYIYSGAVAGQVYGRIQIPQQVVLLCFHHRGQGADWAIWPPGAWETPLGRVPIAADLAESVREACDAIFDESGHRGEHSGEVQVPFLQNLRPDVQIVPFALSVGLESIDRLKQVGKRLATLKGDFLVIASTDLNHYDPHEETMVKDKWAIDAILSLDEESLARAIVEKDVRMCGFAPTIAMISYLRSKGVSKLTLIDHKTSFDAGGDRNRTVGYAGIIASKGQYNVA